MIKINIKKTALAHISIFDFLLNQISNIAPL